MANNYKLKPIFNTIKEGYQLYEGDNLVYEAQMAKFHLFGASPFNFVNHKTNKTEEHKVGKTVNTSLGEGWEELLSRKSSFKYDDTNIWDYLHDKGIRIKTDLSSGKLGLTYVISFEGNEIATMATSTPEGKFLITSSMYYDVTCEEKDLDLVFLVAFAIAKTDRLMYN